MDPTEEILEVFEEGRASARCRVDPRLPKTSPVSLHHIPGAAGGDVPGPLGALSLVRPRVDPERLLFAAHLRADREAVDQWESVERIQDEASVLQSHPAYAHADRFGAELRALLDRWVRRAGPSWTLASEPPTPAVRRSGPYSIWV